MDAPCSGNSKTSCDHGAMQARMHQHTGVSAHGEDDVREWASREMTKLESRAYSYGPALLLRENPDILATTAGGRDRPQLLIGFAAETEDVIKNATRKRKNKGVDWIVANDVSPARGKGNMGGDENTVHLISEGKAEDWEPMSKQAVARRLVEKIAAALNHEGGAERDD